MPDGTPIDSESAMNDPGVTAAGGAADEGGVNRPRAAVPGAPRIGVPGEDPFEPERRCPQCGAKLTVQILPQGFVSHCTPCERRGRAAAQDRTAE